MDAKEAELTLRSAREMLDIARLGQHDYEAASERRQSGLYQAITSARSVTFTLQNMRGHVPGFDEWYSPWQARLKADPVCVWFVGLRNNIEKRGNPGQQSISVSITSLNSDDLFRNAPPGTVGTFLYDGLGRCGWIVKLADGSEQTVYFSLPQGVGEARLHFEKAPDQRDVGALLEEYLGKIEEVLLDAEATFAPKE